jgi:ankyrin repeat protein
MLKTPFPTVFEGLRLLFKALDIKAGNKTIDDEARNVWADYRYLDEFIKDFAGKRLEIYSSTEISSFFQLELRGVVDEYLQLVATHSADGLTREEVMKPLIEFWLVPRLASVVNSICIDANLVSVIELFSSQCAAVPTVLSWLDQNSAAWSRYKKPCEKEQKDRIAAWQRGESLPSSQFISLLDQGDVNNEQTASDWLKIKTLLFIARAIDSIRKEELGELIIEKTREFLKGSPVYKRELGRELDSLRLASIKRVSSILQSIGSLGEDMLRSKEKIEKDKNSLRLKIDHIRFTLIELGEYENSSFFIDWMDARWHVYSGDLAAANELYKQSVKTAIYRSGDQLQVIIKEALVVAASIKKSGKASPDKAFLKQLKNILILFNLDVESVDQLHIRKPKNKTDEFIQASEIEMWKGSFNKIFPIKGFFSKSDFFQSNEGTGPILIIDEKHSKPDYQHVNRNIKVGENRQKVFPQIVWFVHQENYPAVEKLIEKGARVDVSSSSGDTPLIMALEKLVVMEFPRRSFDDSFFNLIIEQPKVTDTINSQTQKRKLTPLLLAVRSGRPDIVEKLLSLGADSNLRGDSDNQTALNICLKLFSLCKNPNRLFESLLEQRATPEALDSFRRESNALFGHMLEDQVNAMLRRNSPDDLMKIERYILNEYVSQVVERLSSSKLKEIFNILLQSGANPNAEMTTPLKGYTPLMLAVELDLDKEVALMLSKGGDLNKAYIHPDTREQIDSWRLAELWQSNKVLRLMNDIKPMYQRFNNVL